jgi:hypothetical protein
LFINLAKQENVLKLILSAVEDDQQFEYCDFVSKVLLSPEQWSSLLYDDTQHESLMQSIIDTSFIFSSNM